jgi:hypothetical protein
MESSVEGFKNVFRSAVILMVLFLLYGVIFTLLVLPAISWSVKGLVEGRGKITFPGLG